MKINPKRLTEEKLIELLKLRGREQKELFETARKIRKKEFGKSAFIRAVIESSSYCAEDCLYCPMRRSNRQTPRYKLGLEEIIESAQSAMDLGINTILLESGEDRSAVNVAAEATLVLKEKNAGVILCLGDLKKEEFKKLKDAGADAYILKFETSDARLFEKMRPGASLKKRIENLNLLRKLGFAISTGNIAGLPEQTVQSVAQDILLAKKINPAMVSASPFIPAKTTPLEKSPKGNANLALNTIAIYRILFPKAIIPTVSAFNYYPKIGQLGGFNAGANTITVNFTPKKRNFSIYATKRV
ncbi:MAG: radical SAM protein, partial [archaeon]